MKLSEFRRLIDRYSEFHPDTEVIMEIEDAHNADIVTAHVMDAEINEIAPHPKAKGTLNQRLVLLGSR